MNSFRIFYSDGNTNVTSFNGTLADAIAYFVGQTFWYWRGDNMPEGWRVGTRVIQL